ncbi:immune inhibitor A domain-containing protein [Kocuria sp. NPDC057446]|uniref:immune inhibitor A domain-containing protein n=1 Tax=Kocuria sp. NPDC057446 TaxID=3346137 RepID=UPI0036D0580E
MPHAADPVAAHSDDRTDPAAAERRRLNGEAVERIVTGRAEVQDRGGSRAVQLEPGVWAQYGAPRQAEILTFLVEFGEKKDPRFPDAPSGPGHNAIPRPDRTVDNVTHWTNDFDRAHYTRLLFADDGDSMRDLYREMSRGRHLLSGAVEDWVRVPWHSASYGQTENQEDMTRFVQDTADAWYTAQKAAGRTAAEIDADLTRFDRWDRYDHDSDGDFAEPDGYIDHFQAVHAGEGEEAGAPASAIWSHRWAVNQDGAGTDGPASNPAGGIRIGDSQLWIRDYTTEPENGGLGVFAHEYAHDLGLPDLYDTAGGENGTGFWTLMSAGGWLSREGDAIGTAPDHMGAWEKLQLGWLDYEVAIPGRTSIHVLGASADPGAAAQGLVVVLPTDENGRNRYYLAENRRYVGYDATLRSGPYNFGRSISAPNLVERFPYQDGLSISYWNTAVPDNNTSQHPGSGLVLPVDARPEALRWSDGAPVRNRIQSYDATFGTQGTDGIELHHEVAGASSILRAGPRPAVDVFDDTDPAAYYDPLNPQGSVVVAGVGTTVRVLEDAEEGPTTVRVEWSAPGRAGG